MDKKILNKIRLLMFYDNSKPLNEQKTYPVVPSNISNFKTDFDKDKMVYDPNITTPSKEYDENGNIITKEKKTGGVVPITVKNVGLRGTPFGFNPDEYPEYLKKIKDIKQEFTPDEPNYNIALNNLKKQYYHPDFYKGISKDDFNSYQTQSKDIEYKKYKNAEKIKKDFDPYYKNNPGSDRLDAINNNIINKITTSKTSNDNDVYDNKKEMLDIVYERDPTSLEQLEKLNQTDLENFWEKNGWKIEFIGWIILDIFTEGIALEVSGVRQGKLIQKIVNYFERSTDAERTAKFIRLAGRVGVPTAVGIGVTINEGELNENGLIYFIFAILPYAHSFLGLSKPTKEICNSILRKMSKNNINTPEGLKLFIKSLTNEEKKIVRDVFSITPETKIKNIKSFIHSITKETIKKIKKIPNGELIKPSGIKTFLKFFGVQIPVDLTIIKLLEYVFNYAGIINDEEKKQLKKQFEEHAKLMNTDRDDQIIAALKLGIDLKNKNKIEMEKIYNPENNSQYSEEDAQKIAKGLTFETIMRIKK